MHSERSRQVVERLANVLLDAKYDFEGEHKRWLTFGVPRVWDLAERPQGPLPRTATPAIRVSNPSSNGSLARQDESGRWPCGSTSRTWPLESPQPSQQVGNPGCAAGVQDGSTADNP